MKTVGFRLQQGAVDAENWREGFCKFIFLCSTSNNDFPMGKLASGLSSIYTRYFLFGVLFVLAFITTLIEIAAGLKS